MLAQQSDPLEEVADFQKQPSRLPPLAELAEGTALAVHQDAAGVAPRTGHPGLRLSAQPLKKHKQDRPCNAARYGDRERMLHWLGEGATPDGEASGTTPLCHAAYANGGDGQGALMVNTLIEHGADPNLSQHLDGQTPLSIATREGNTETAAALIQAGAGSSRSNAQTVAWLQKDFSGELGVTAPGVTRAGATATVFLPRRDSAGRGLVEDSANGKRCYVAVQSPSHGDGRQERLYFATRRGASEPPT